MLGNSLLLGSQGYQVSRSVRLRASASAYFSRTLGTPTNSSVWTFSFWVKKSVIGTTQEIINASNTSANQCSIQFNSSDQLRVINYIGSAFKTQYVTTQVFRDVSSWYHIVVRQNSSSGFFLYVNGVQVTSFATATGPDASGWLINQSGLTANIAREQLGSVNYFDGYLAEVNFIDGQALTPSSFGSTNAVTGVWGPAKYTGTYGTNGFYLKFTNNSAATAAAIGADYSGNGNNWTPNNISVTAGTTYDSMIDVPNNYADGGTGRGNYCTLNPLRYSTNGTLSSANLNYANGSSDNNAKAFATFGITTGKWYYEAAYISGVSDSRVLWGFGTDTTSVTSVSLPFEYSFNGQSANTMQVAIDYDAGKIWYGFNNTWVGSGNPATGANPYQTFTPASYPILVPGVRIYGAADGTTTSAANFGQRPFAYTPPSGFNALNTQNLSAPTISNGANWMAATLYTGNGSSLTVSNAVNGISFQPDLLWVKVRSQADNNVLVDSVRGPSLRLFSNLTNAESTGGASSLNSNGFTLSSTSASMNNSGQTYVAWQWKKSATPGFDIVAYAGTGVAKTVAHSLGVVPAMFFTKNRTTGVANWLAYHSVIGATNYLLPNTTAASAASANPWNNTAPTSSVFTVGTSAASNESGSNMIAYLWAPVAGYSAFGSYTGNASTDGPFIYTGFRPRYVLVKRTDSTSDWYVWDTSRDTYNVEAATLLIDTTGAETSATSIDGLSNGFKCRSATVVNASGGTYIYAAFAENPFKYALAR